MLLTPDPTATSALLDAGQLACPSCGGELGPWGTPAGGSFAATTAGLTGPDGPGAGPAARPT